MARARNIKPGLFKNELLGVADPLLTLLFQSLWTLADKEGRLEDRPLRIKAETFPYRDGLDVNGYLTELQRLGFIVRYLVDGLALIQVVNFKKHQTPHNTEKPSELPPVEAGTVTGCALQDTSVKSPLSNGENVDALPPDSLLLIPPSLITDSLISDTGLPSKDLSAPSAQTAKKGTQLPADWKLSKEWGDWALSEKPAWTADDVRRVADDFKDHWLSNANQAKSKKADWFATWRKWVRSPLNEIKSAKPANKHTSLVDSNRAAINEWLKTSERVVS